MAGRGMGGGRGVGGGRGTGRGGAAQRRRDGSCRTAAEEGTLPVVTRPRLVAVVARPEDCTACGSCADACPRDAITVDDVARIDDARCNGCGACVTECPNGALELAEA